MRADPGIERIPQRGRVPVPAEFGVQREGSAAVGADARDDLTRRLLIAGVADGDGGAAAPSLRAIARPIPLLPPVTSAVLPLSACLPMTEPLPASPTLFVEWSLKKDANTLVERVF